MTIKSQPLDFAVSIIAVAGCASETCKSSTDIPICSAIARASSSTLPARTLQATSQSCWEIPPPACPLTNSMTGSGSVTVMTVTLVFKAFAKARPCLTPFLARSDPSVLKRISVYIRGSLARLHSRANKSLTRHLSHGFEHALVSDTSPGHLEGDHALALDR